MKNPSVGRASFFMEFEALSALSFEAKPLTVVAAAASAAWLCSEAFVPGVQLNREAQARVAIGA